MLVKFLGIFDLFVAVILFALALKFHISALLVIILIIVLAAKSLPFLLNFCLGSIIDLIAGIVFLLSLFFTLNPLILVITALVIGQKGVVSLF
ncbi:MAG: hypothetical protein QXK80_02950 [Candidatus Pacearchaeota archaeon]